jgi:VWFA-related protein
MNLVQKIALISVAGMAAALSAFPAQGQESAPRLTITSITDGDYPEARAILGVEYAGDAAPTLTVADFTLTADGEPAPIKRAELASSEDEPLEALLLMDTSGTTEGSPLAAAKSAAKAFLQELAPEDRVAVMSFSDDVHLLQDYTNDRALVTAAIDALQSGGNTALYQATAVASFKAAQSPAKRKALILLSDAAGEYGGKSIATREEAIAAAQAAGVPFFNIVQGSGEDTAYFQQVAEATRGRLLQAAGPEDLQALYVSIGRLLRSQYVITFDASAVSAEGARVRITVRTAGSEASADAPYTPGPDFLPSVSLVGVRGGETLNAPREITATVSSGTPRVRWYIDDVNVFETTAPPYVFTYDPSRFEGGEHTLRVAIGEGTASAETSVSFSSTPPPPAPGGGPPFLLIGAVVFAMALGAGAFFVMKARRPKGERPIPAEQRTKSWAAQVAAKRAAAGEAPAPGTEVVQEDIGDAMGLLISRSGNGAGQEYAIGGKPVSVGAGARCGVRIRDDELASEEARVWVRGGHLMLHLFTRLTTVEASGLGGGWQILEPGDTFQIGQHTFEFRLLPAPQAAGTDDAPVPNVLRDRESADAAPRPGRLTDLMPHAD